MLRRLEVAESAQVSVVRFKDQKIIDPEAIQELGDELFTLVTGLVPISLVVLVKYWQAWRRHRRPPAEGALDG